MLASRQEPQTPPLQRPGKPSLGIPTAVVSTAPLRLGVACLTLIVSLPWLLMSDGVAALVAAFSVLTAGTAQMLPDNTLIAPAIPADREFLAGLRDIGMAGVGTLIVLFVLA